MTTVKMKVTAVGRADTAINCGVMTVNPGVSSRQLKKLKESVVVLTADKDQSI